MDDAESRLYEDLKWAGLQWDEGMGHAALLRACFLMGNRSGYWRYLRTVQAGHQHPSNKQNFI